MERFNDILTRAGNTFKRMDKPARILVLVLFIVIAAEIPIFLLVGAGLKGAQPPVLQGFTPVSNPAIDEGGTIEFSVTATSPDGSALSYRWTVNGVAAGGNQPAFQFKTDARHGGLTHQVQVAVGCDGGVATRAWTVTVNNLVVRLCTRENDDSNYDWLIPAGDKVYFLQDIDEEFTTLWRSDGTVEGTYAIWHFGNYRPYDEDSFAVMGDLLYFVGGDSTHGQEIWVTDGTHNNTRRVTSFTPANPGIDRLTAVGTTLFFRANGGTGGLELWKTDGTWPGTSMVKDINQEGDSWPYDLVAAGTFLFFNANNGTGYHLMRSDGTEGGTRVVKNLPPASNMRALGTRLFFTCNNGTTGDEPWITNGNDVGTIFLKDIYEGGLGCNPSYVTVAGAYVYFSANDGINGDEPWRTDGTPAGTIMVKNIHPAGGSSPESFTLLRDGIVVFAAYHPDTGMELYRTDGTVAGTYIVKDINPGTESSYPYASEPTYAGSTLGHVIFPADDGVHGKEPWITDGTTAGTRLLRDIMPGGSASDSYPDYFTKASHLVFFFADEPGGTALYVY